MLLFLIHGSEPCKFFLWLLYAVPTLRIGIFIIFLRGSIFNNAPVILIFVLLSLLILSPLILLIINKLEGRLLIDLVTVLFLQFEYILARVSFLDLAHRLIR